MSRLYRSGEGSDKSAGGGSRRLEKTNARPDEKNGGRMLGRNCPSPRNANFPAPTLESGNTADQKLGGDEVDIGSGIAVTAGDEASGTNGYNPMNEERGFGLCCIEGRIF